MRNGEGKNWLTSLVAKIVKDHPEIQNIKSQEPPPHSGIINAVELMSITSELVETFWERPIDTESIPSRGSSVNDVADTQDDTPEISVRKHKCVPDFVVFLGSYPGMFPLVADIKGAKEDWTNQNLEQMLSKLYFQDVILGSWWLQLNMFWVLS